MTLESGSQVRLVVRVRGMVQGVGYRYYAYRRARALGITGFARNELDRSVTVEAEGSRAALEQFLDDLRRGPEGAHVQDAAPEWRPATDEFSGFRMLSA